MLIARSPNLNAYAERRVRSVKEECLSKVVLPGERSLRRALSEYVEHYHAERNHQGKGNVLLFPQDTKNRREQSVQCRQRLGGAPALLSSGASLNNLRRRQISELKVLNQVTNLAEKYSTE